jgi:uncharacterized protein with HEPN domain
MHPSQIEFLKHILDECKYFSKEYSENSFEYFSQNDRLSRAVCRSLEIIGEACNKLSPDLKAAYPHIPWREMSDIRNRIIHHYFGIDYDIVWDTVKNDIPVLQEYISVIISDNRMF